MLAKRNYKAVSLKGVGLKNSLRHSLQMSCNSSMKGAGPIYMCLKKEITMKQISFDGTQMYSYTLYGTVVKIPQNASVSPDMGTISDNGIDLKIRIPKNASYDKESVLSEKDKKQLESNASSSSGMGQKKKASLYQCGNMRSIRVGDVCFFGCTLDRSIEHSRYLPGDILEIKGIQCTSAKDKPNESYLNCKDFRLEFSPSFDDIYKVLSQLFDCYPIFYPLSRTYLTTEKAIHEFLTYCTTSSKKKTNTLASGTKILDLEYPRWKLELLNNLLSEDIDPEKFCYSMYWLSLNAKQKSNKMCLMSFNLFLEEQQLNEDEVDESDSESQNTVGKIEAYEIDGKCYIIRPVIIPTESNDQLPIVLSSAPTKKALLSLTTLIQELKQSEQPSEETEIVSTAVIKLQVWEKNAMHLLGISTIEDWATFAPYILNMMSQSVDGLRILSLMSLNVNGSVENCGSVDIDNGFVLSYWSKLCSSNICEAIENVAFPISYEKAVEYTSKRLKTQPEGPIGSQMYTFCIDSPSSDEFKHPNILDLGRYRSNVNSQFKDMYDFYAWPNFKPELEMMLKLKELSKAEQIKITDQLFDKKENKDLLVKYGFIPKYGQRELLVFGIPKVKKQLSQEHQHKISTMVDLNRELLNSVQETIVKDESCLDTTDIKDLPDLMEDTLQKIRDSPQYSYLLESKEINHASLHMLETHDSNQNSDDVEMKEANGEHSNSINNTQKSESQHIGRPSIVNMEDLNDSEDEQEVEDSEDVNVTDNEQKTISQKSQKDSTQPSNAKQHNRDPNTSVKANKSSQTNQEEQAPPKSDRTAQKKPTSSGKKTSSKKRNGVKASTSSGTTKPSKSSLTKRKAPPQSPGGDEVERESKKAQTSA